LLGIFGVVGAAAAVPLSLFTKEEDIANTVVKTAVNTAVKTTPTSGNAWLEKCKEEVPSNLTSTIYGGTFTSGPYTYIYGGYLPAKIPYYHNVVHTYNGVYSPYQPPPYRPSNKCVEC